MLRETRMFIAAPGSSMAPEDGMVPMRYLPNQLHEPSSENISLGLPVLHWVDSTWDPKSPEAQFLFSIGLLKVCRAPASFDHVSNIAKASLGGHFSGNSLFKLYRQAR